MSDYIERQAVIDAIHCDITITGRQNAELVAATIGTFADRLKSLPAADVVQVVHGKWKYKGVCGIENNIAIRRYKCSECREDIVCDYPYNFCPNCGAKMDGERKEEHETD